MPILAIETSTSVARVVVADSDTGARRAAAEAVAERHSSNVLRLCAEVTEKAGVAIADLSAIACGAGPGSFTGLRVGLAVAKGLAMPTDIPLVLVSSLEALAVDMLPAASSEELLLACLDAGKGQIYAAFFGPRVEPGVGPPGDGRVTALSDEWAVAPDVLPGRTPADVPIVCGGPGALRYRDALTLGLGSRCRFLEVAGPSADSVARRALEKQRLGQIDNLGPAVPSYGRPPDVTRPKRSTP